MTKNPEILNTAHIGRFPFDVVAMEPRPALKPLERLTRKWLSDVVSRTAPREIGKESVDEFAGFNK